MKIRLIPMVPLAVVLCAGAVALFHSSGSASEAHRPMATPMLDEPEPTTSPATTMPALPPKHPPIDQHGGGDQNLAPPSDESPSITWKAPAAFKTAPNPNAMRLETYKVGADAELSIARAGGSTNANIERWVGQFDDAGQDKRTVKTVHGITVTVVEISGTFLGGMMKTGSKPDTHPGWTLVGAIVEAEGTPYFFKLVGPTATVKAARPAFDAMIDGLQKP